MRTPKQTKLPRSIYEYGWWQQQTNKNAPPFPPPASSGKPPASSGKPPAAPAAAPATPAPYTCTSRIDNGLNSQPCTSIPCKYLVDCQSQCHWDTNSKEYNDMFAHCNQIGQSPLIGPAELLGSSTPGRPPGDLPQAGKAITDPVVEPIKQLASIPGNVSKAVIDTWNYIFAPCKWGDYQIPVPCWFGGLVVIMVLYVLARR